MKSNKKNELFKVTIVNENGIYTFVNPIAIDVKIGNESQYKKIGRKPLNRR